MKNQVTAEKLDKYLDLTEQAIAKVKITKKEGEICLDMAKRYLSDAKHFKDTGDFINAFAAVNYAHGWLDSAARLSLFDVGGDNRLFTVD